MGTKTTVAFENEQQKNKFFSLLAGQGLKLGKGFEALVRVFISSQIVRNKVFEDAKHRKKAVKKSKEKINGKA